MFFDFEDGRPDIAPVGQELPASNYSRTLHLKAGPISLQLDLGPGRPGRPLSGLVAVGGTWAIHLLALAFIVFAPQLFRTSIEQANRARLARLAELERQKDETAFVFVQPRLD